VVAADFRTEGAAAGLLDQLAQAGVDRIHGLVNNAGTWLRAPLVQTTGRQWQELLAVNLVAPAECIGLAVARGCTSVVNIVDATADRGWPNRSAYGASKAALVALTRSAAVELGPAVRVNAVAPGLLTVPPDASLSDGLLRRVPAGRMGRVQEVAQVGADLLEGPDYLTGQVVAVDGGLTAR